VSKLVFWTGVFLQSGEEDGQFASFDYSALVIARFIGVSFLTCPFGYVATGVGGAFPLLNVVVLSSYVGSFKTLTSAYFSLIILLTSNSL
jgi:hypothetical protein